METKNILIFLLLINGIFSLQLQLINEDYVEVQIGYPAKTYKLIVDPVAPFTYIFNPEVLKSNSTESLKETDEFTNVFGSFEGEWREDFFYLTNDRLMNFRLQYLYITEISSVKLYNHIFLLLFHKHHFQSIYNLLCFLRYSSHTGVMLFY